MAEVKTLFYRFDQNNSGGSFDIDDKRGIGPNVWVEAVDYNHANSRAEDIGIYFDGCDSELDCPCCGDRWYRAWNNKIDNYDVSEKTITLDDYSFGWHDTVYVHYLNGIIERLTKYD